MKSNIGFWLAYLNLTLACFKGQFGNWNGVSPKMLALLLFFSFCCLKWRNNDLFIYYNIYCQAHQSKIEKKKIITLFIFLHEIFMKRNHVNFKERRLKISYLRQYQCLLKLSPVRRQLSLSYPNCLYSNLWPTKGGQYHELHYRRICHWIAF